MELQAFGFIAILVGGLSVGSSYCANLRQQTRALVPTYANKHAR